MIIFYIGNRTKNIVNLKKKKTELHSKYKHLQMCQKGKI